MVEMMTKSELQAQENRLVDDVPELPPRSIPDQSPTAPYVPNQDVFAVLKKNIRQVTSLTAGEL